ncbi:hypothetical protein ADUPG1_005549, partial [Aduncisulcus paluster]
DNSEDEANDEYSLATESSDQSSSSSSSKLRTPTSEKLSGGFPEDVTSRLNQSSTTNPNHPSIIPSLSDLPVTHTGGDAIGSATSVSTSDGTGYKGLSVDTLSSDNTFSDSSNKTTLHSPMVHSQLSGRTAHKRVHSGKSNSTSSYASSGSSDIDSDGTTEDITFHEKESDPSLDSDPNEHKDHGIQE